MNTSAVMTRDVVVVSPSVPEQRRDLLGVDVGEKALPLFN